MASITAESNASTMPLLHNPLSPSIVCQSCHTKKMQIYIGEQSNRRREKGRSLAPIPRSIEIAQVCLSQSNPHRQHHLTLIFQTLKSPNDVEALRSLMEIQIKNQKVHEAISIIERLSELEPSDIEWPFLRAHMHCYGGETELAESRFNEIIDKDPFCVEAYHGLVLPASQEDSD
ncbi:unnamed protein product [Ilex paraguariensis]|uniref:Uncharacterized protein n=1 Tax=Ilex paraguariensis TaxID=185542 RepID=A0ABC8S936_9AQUA